MAYVVRQNLALSSATSAALSFEFSKKTSSVTFPESHSFREPICLPLLSTLYWRELSLRFRVLPDSILARIALTSRDERSSAMILSIRAGL